MKEKDHIEDYFKKYLEHYEESPDEDFWASVVPAIEVQKERNNHKVLWILLLLLSLLLTGFLVRSIAWDRDLNFEKGEEHIPLAIDDVLIEDPIPTNKQKPILGEEQPIQKEEKLVAKIHKTQIIEEGQSNLVIEKENIKLLPQVFELKNQKTAASVSLIENSISTIQPLEVESLPDRIAALNYMTPKLPEYSRPLRVQPYVSLHSYQLQGVTYEGIQQVNRKLIDRQLSRPINTIFNFGLDAGVTLNEQFYIQVGFNQDFSRFTHKETISKSISEREIAILFDGVPINFDFTMNPYFDEIEGKLKLTPKTSEIEAGDKFFSIEAQRKVQTTRWTLATAYKIDVNNIVRLTPKFGISKVDTKYELYERISGKEILFNSDGKEIDNQLNTEISITSTGKEIQIKNIEWLFGFQAEIPIDKREKWLIIPMGELWFDAKPILENSDVKLQRSILTFGAGLRYLIH